MPNARFDADVVEVAVELPPEVVLEPGSTEISKGTKAAGASSCTSAADSRGGDRD